MATNCTAGVDSSSCNGITGCTWDAVTGCSGGATDVDADGADYSTLIDTNSVQVFTKLIKPLRERVTALQMVLQQLRISESQCKSRLENSKQGLRSAMLKWQEHYSRYLDEFHEWKRLDTKCTEAANTIAAMKSSISDDGIQHAKVQAQYKLRTSKWQKGEAALLQAIGQLSGLPYFKRQQATDDITAEHAEYKHLLAIALKTLNAFETEA